ncbi:serine hydrolase domain-containing protein [Paenibacillus sp. UNC451MF]|uniref:serine hydrolase domain-containing protein n=1 Tax=Paenibacillus sp. UNC451MF TaxID=1449063 RepID=UPI000689BD3D|nr:serine hydrolase domain-containing protein [Paenibacillus sp. UNC451MF]
MTDQLLESKLVEQFDAYAEAQQFSGTILVAQEGHIRFAKAYGLANCEHEVPNRMDTKFQIASITKPITAVAVLMLAEQGLIHVHEQALEYLPECAGQGLDSRITVHHLLTHTSGIRDFEKLPQFVGGQEKSLYEGLDILKLIQHAPQEFEPGTKWSYCNTGYNLLGVLIESVTGISYSDFIAQQLLVPLGMHSTGFGCSGSIVHGRADGYSLNEQGTQVKARFFELGNFSGSGHMYSTAEDLLKWDQALYPGQLLSEELLRPMFMPHAFVDTTRHYGYGWSLYGTSRGHGGWLPGYWCKFRQYPEQKQVVIMLSNQDYSKEERILDRTEALLKECL